MAVKSFNVFLAFAGAVFLSWGIVWLASGYYGNILCRDLDVRIINEHNNFLLDIDAAKKMVWNVHNGNVVGSRMRDISVFNIEQGLEMNPFIRNAEAYKNPDGVMKVEIELRKPVARIMNTGGSAFYMDSAGVKFPLSDLFSANVLIVRGDFQEPLLPGDSIISQNIQKLTPVLVYVDNDPFLRAQISEIQVREDGQLILYPEIGNIEVEFGDCQGYEEKFDRLMIFYRKVLCRTGWDVYDRISLKFKDQIVARKFTY